MRSRSNHLIIQTSDTPLSHLDCRWLLVLIVALQVFEEKEIDSALVVTQGANSSSILKVMNQTRSTTSVSGSSYGNQFSGSANTNSTNVPIYRAKSKAEFSAILRDVRSSRTVWYADISVKASGTLFVSEKGDAKGAVSEVVDALESDGHLRKPVKQKKSKK